MWFLYTYSPRLHGVFCSFDFYRIKNNYNFSEISFKYLPNNLKFNLNNLGHIL